MNDPTALHEAGHSLGLWIFSGTSPWFEFVLHSVLLVAPLALLVVIATWSYRLIRALCAARQQKESDEVVHIPYIDLFRYLLKHTWRIQLALVVAALVALPMLYAGLELPKLIINGAISSGHFPVDFLSYSLSQTGLLFALCALYLFTILINGSLKFWINLQKGRVAEALLQRLRLSIYRYWRRGSRSGERSEVIPMMVQEIEPIGGFAGDAFVTPLFQGGTFLTILLFMFLQDPILGAAAVTLLPIQLAAIPRLQRRINALSRLRAHEMRHLSGTIGREIASPVGSAGQHRRPVCETIRRIAAIRYEIYQRKYFLKGLNNFITQLTPFFFYTIGGYLVIEERLSFGALVAVLAAHKDFSSPLKELFRYYQTMEDVRVRFHEMRRLFVENSSASMPTSPDARFEKKSDASFPDLDEAGEARRAPSSALWRRPLHKRRIPAQDHPLRSGTSPAAPVN